MIELIYTSAARRSMEPFELGQLLERARENNGKLDVTGILLYDAGSFIQVLEGEPLSVRPLFERIARDARHDRVQVLRESSIAARSFAGWSMGFVTLDVRVMRAFPRRHGLSSNGSLQEDASAVLEFLDAFRDGRFRNYIQG